MKIIKFVKGDVRDVAYAKAGEKAIIPHVCNNVGAWGAGFVMALSRRWKEPEKMYRQWYRNAKSGSVECTDSEVTAFNLGMTQFVNVSEDIIVANMVAQNDLRRVGSEPPIRYDSLRRCLSEVAHLAKWQSASVHIPDLIGCGLAGGDPKIVLGIIQETLVSQDIDVYIYKFEN